MWDLKKNPPETMDVAFLFWNHKKIGQHLLPLKVPHRKIEFGIVFMFLYLLIHSLIHIFEKIGQHLLPLKVRHRNIDLWIDLLNVYLDSCLFLGLNLIPINTGMAPLFFKIFQKYTPGVSSVNSQHLSVVFAYGHTTLSTPDLVRSRKLSRVGPG